MDTIHLEDLAYFAFHGLHDEEARLGQRFIVDLTCWVDLGPASRTDKYADTVCYATLTRAIENVVTTARFNLIERLAGAIAEAVFATDERIERLRVRVHKPGAPLPIASGRVSVEITRSRNSDAPDA
ncbi:dihydroneopterin aldolase [Stappia sp.]|jgi:dihydroneopterin aldolase|uniref:dihydroneopterin aldolase n=1 Tax=Stappia sp. TaxID=1870903 RepID=UPI003A9A13E5